MELAYKIGEVYDAPRPCPKCRHVKAIFQATATCYGEWWICVKCGEVFDTYERCRHGGIGQADFIVTAVPQFPPILWSRSKCPNCGYWCQLDWDYCPKCGKYLHETSVRSNE